MKATYENIKQAVTAALDDLNILAGDKIGPSDVSWRDVAGTAAVNFHHVAYLLEHAREAPESLIMYFPSPSECLEDKE